MMEEIWRDIKDYEGLYQVSNLGNVKRILFRNGKYQFKKERIRKLSYDKYGYKKCVLAKNGKMKQYFVHRLVAQAFIPNLENKPQVNHIDGNKENNNIDNLEWVTSSENRIHAYKNGLNKKYYGEKHWNYNKRGNKHPQSKKIIQYDENGNIIKIWDSIGEAGRNTKISLGSIICVCRKKRNKAGGYIWRYKEEENEFGKNVHNI